MNEQLKNLIIERERYNTSHGFHLLLTFFTGGMWAVVWFLQHIGNKQLAKECDAKIKALMDESEETK